IFCGENTRWKRSKTSRFDSWQRFSPGSCCHLSCLAASNPSTAALSVLEFIKVTSEDTSLISSKTFHCRAGRATRRTHLRRARSPRRRAIATSRITLLAFHLRAHLRWGGHLDLHSVSRPHCHLGLPKGVVVSGGPIHGDKVNARGEHLVVRNASLKRGALDIRRRNGDLKLAVLVGIAKYNLGLMFLPPTDRLNYGRLVRSYQHGVALSGFLQIRLVLLPNPGLFLSFD